MESIADAYERCPLTKIMDNCDYWNIYLFSCLFYLRLHSFTILIKAFRSLLPFLSVKGLTHVYLVKTSMTHNKYLTFSFLEDNDPISAKSTA